MFGFIVRIRVRFRGASSLENSIGSRNAHGRIVLFVEDAESLCTIYAHVVDSVMREKQCSLVVFVRLHRLVVLMLRVKSSCFASEQNLDVHVGLVLRYTAATFNGS